MTPAQVRALVDEYTAGPGSRRPRRATGQRASAQPRARRRGRLGPWEPAAGSGSTSAQRRAWARPTPCWARATAAPSAGPTWSSGSSRPTAGSTPRRCSRAWRWSRAARSTYRETDVRGDGRRCRAGPAAAGGPGRRVRPHQRPGLAQRQAVAGHRGAAGGGHRRHHDRQHPAPGVGQRRRREDHRRTPAGDRARRRRPGGRPDRAGGHDRRGAATPSGARQRLRAREDRRRPLELLPAREPQRPARAGPAVDRGPGRRRPPAVPREARHHRHLGGPGAGRRRADRWARGRDAGTPCGAHRCPLQRRRPARRTRRTLRRTGRREPGRPGRAAPARRVARRHVPPGARRRRPQRAARVRAGRERHPARARGQPSTRLGPVVQPGNGRAHRAFVRRHRRPHRHARTTPAGGWRCPRGAAA